MKQIQIFLGPYHPRTGEERKLGVLWDDNHVLATGTPEEIIASNPGVPVREGMIRISLRDMKRFSPVIGIPGETHD